jgi:hypothetical protein
MRDIALWMCTLSAQKVGAAVAEQGTGERRAVGAAAMAQVDGCTIGAKRLALSKETHRNTLICR